MMISRSNLRQESGGMTWPPRHAASSAPAKPNRFAAFLPLAEIPCPCCQRDVPAPSLDMVIDHYKLSPMQARILSAVWKGKGYPVQTNTIFDAMFYDRADGGPGEGAMYATFKVSLSRLRVLMHDSGVAIENVGYRRGYRLIVRKAA